MRAGRFLNKNFLLSSALLSVSLKMLPNLLKTCSLRGRSRGGAFAACVLTLLCLSMSNARAQYVDPLDVPAIPALVPDQAPMLTLASAGDHFVAAGARGVILVSQTKSDGSLKWVQASVPVQADLVSLSFASPTDGWAGGHGGVILHTSDGGLHWTKQLDGWSANSAFMAYYKQQAASGSKTAANDQQQVQFNFGTGPILPWLGIWFTSSTTGFAVGPFGDIAATADGGQTWIPWFDHINNPNYYNLNDIKEVGGQLYIVGEQGGVYVFDPIKQQFNALNTGYDGSFFGLTGTGQYLIVFGLRGTIYRSPDQGKTWTQIQDPIQATLSDGTVMPDGTVVLVAVDGKILTSKDGGNTFEVDPDDLGAPLSGVEYYKPGQVIVSGLGGVRSAAIE